MFVLSKIFGFLLNPALWIIAILLIAWRTRNPYRKKRMLFLGLITFLFFSNPYLIGRITQAYQTPPMPMKAGEQYDAGLLLGGMMTYDEPSATAYFNSSADRFIQAYKLYKEGYIRKIIVSGGNANIQPGAYREADWIIKNLREMGVPGDDILMERESRNTVENARLARRITDSLHSRKPIVVITSAWHMPRTLKIFEKEKIPVRPFPSDYQVGPSPRLTASSFVPNASAMLNWSRMIKEWLGYWAIGLQRS
jgi:uncharacterized SAM-binding protein YcdF (DUF218 family)